MWLPLPKATSLMMLHVQCPKLRVHPAPGVHISTTGCTILGCVHPVCARCLSHLLLLYIGRVHGAISGCTVLSKVHPVSAQNKSLISDTDVAAFAKSHLPYDATCSYPCQKPPPLLCYMWLPQVATLPEATPLIRPPVASLARSHHSMGE